MDKTTRLIIVFLVIALVFSTVAIAVKNYFPELRAGARQSSNGGVPAGNIQITIEKPSNTTTPNTTQ